jgi:tetratricopeptide (TPR) repeat protein/predicted aspartyl protease
MRKQFIVMVAALISSSAANAACQVGKLLEFKVTMQGVRPLADIGINGRTLPFIIDSGAFYSTISPGVAAELGLRLQPSPVQLRGLGGAAGSTYVANVKTLDLAGVALKDIEFIVGGSETGVGGLLGQNVLGIGDVEYDLEHGAIRIMRAMNCSSQNNLAYWSGDKPVSELQIDSLDAMHRHTTGNVLVNGVKLKAVFDTGAGASFLSLEGAKRAGLTPSTPGVVPAGMSRGLGKAMVATWLAPVATVTIGTEQVRDIKMRMGDVELPEADMLIGADFFLSHRVYVANKLHKIYFTYDGGPVFNMTPSRVVDDTGTTQTIAADNGPEPTDAAGFSRRGAAEMSRRDLSAALVDLNRAVAMDPKDAQYLLQRARAHLLSGNRVAAFADLDHAAEIAPADPEIRLAHAESLVGRKRPADAEKDLEAADAALPRQSDERLVLAGQFQRIDRFDKAIANYDQWIMAHPDDSRQPNALNARCWTRALAGHDLPLALKDCDAALHRMKSPSYFDSRGLVELRMGQYDRAIEDYDSALQSSPNSAWSLYGRGLARRHKGDPLGQKDLDAAAAIDPGLPARAKELGIS